MSDSVVKSIAGKVIVGLTGNIATGKSAVMRMAAEGGALTLDADKIVHEILDNNADTQAAVALAFGARLRLPNGRIDRRALGKLVFNDPKALKDLEEMVHPQVRQEISRRIYESTQAIIFVEAIKLLEGELSAVCHQVWVTRCSKQRQLERLMICRGWDTDTAVSRINAQPPQEEKVALADIVIDTDGAMVDTERQFEGAWSRLPDPERAPVKQIRVSTEASSAATTMPTTAKVESTPASTPTASTPTGTTATAVTEPVKPKTGGGSLSDKLAGAKEKLALKAKRDAEAKRLREEEGGTEGDDKSAEKSTPAQPATPDMPLIINSGTQLTEEYLPEGKLEIRRARPADVPSILLLIQRASGGTIRIKRSDMLLALGERSYFLGQIGTDISTIIGWNIENMVSRVEQVYIYPLQAAKMTGKAVFEELEKSAYAHICEIMVVYLPKNSPAEIVELVESQGYEETDASSLPRGWQKSIEEHQPAGTDAFTKILKQRPTME